MHETNIEMLKCFCGKEFNLRHKLTTHLKRVHQNARDHHCKSCPKRFFTPKELTSHELMHKPNYVQSADHFCEVCLFISTILVLTKREFLKNKL